MAQYDVLVAIGGVSGDRHEWSYCGRIHAANPVSALRKAAAQHAFGNTANRRTTLTGCSATLYHKIYTQSPVLKVVCWE
jgi:hypothetical protein